MKRLGLLGPSGFVGSATLTAAQEAGHHVVPISVRMHASDSSGRSHHMRDLYPELYQILLERFDGLDAVINAAGIAQPSRADDPDMRAANALFPQLALEAAHTAGVRRFVHVSSAAVQGRRDPLDETLTWAPFSPYSRAKAEAERRLIDQALAGNVALIVYRATSVQGRGSTTTEQFARLASGSIIPVTYRGRTALPVSLIYNLAAGLLFAATNPRPTGVVLQPDEGITAATLWRIFNEQARLINIPSPLVSSALRLVRPFVYWHPGANAAIRRAELLLLGQGTQAYKLEGCDFRLPVGIDGWKALARSVRPLSTQC